jgi:hypothetical protein
MGCESACGGCEDTCRSRGRVNRGFEIFRETVIMLVEALRMSGLGDSEKSRRDDSTRRCYESANRDCESAIKECEGAVKAMRL